ncbi:hypothetical protein GCM10027575_65780 [Phytohabitans suffuscus]
MSVGSWNYGAWRAGLAAEVGEVGERKRAAGRSGARGSVRSAGGADGGKGKIWPDTPAPAAAGGHGGR